MADAVDWRAKYQNVVRELDAEERSWRELELLLRRLVNRLCVAALGVNEGLDAELNALNSANKRDAGVEELTPICEALSAAITAMAAAVGTGSGNTVISKAMPERWVATIDAVQVLLKRLASAHPEDSITDSLLKQLGDIATDDDLAKILTRVASLVGDRADILARERLEASNLLEHVTQRLDEITGFLTGTEQARRVSQLDTDRLSEQVSQQVHLLNDEVTVATELNALKSAVSGRVGSIATQVQQFRAREQARHAESRQQAERMANRMAELEAQATLLQRNLVDERRRARLDALTGLSNRAAFDERFAQEVARFKRSGMPVSMLLWDVDRFKLINDTYGHRAGDVVLREVAKCLSSGVRESDFVARFGGEEFVTLLIGATLPQALEQAEELRAKVAALPLHYRGEPVRVTVSCGATELRDKDRAELVYDRADAALYRAKNGGRNLCVAA